MTANSGHVDAQIAAQIFRSQRAREGLHLLHRPLGHHFAAVNAGARPEIDDVIGGVNRFLIMLDDDHGVAEIAELEER